MIIGLTIEINTKVNMFRCSPSFDCSQCRGLQTVFLTFSGPKKHKMKQNLLIKKKITQENNMYHMYSHQTIVTKYFCLECKGK